MPRFTMFHLRNSNVVEMFTIRDEIDHDPVYQRLSLWQPEKKRLFIDSVINQVDVPKLYLHELPHKGNGGRKYRYAVIDGKQRLQALWEFMENKFRLAHDFEFFDDPEVKAGGACYDDLLARYPALRGRFDSFDVPIVVVRAQDERVIEDLFSRLNMAMPLSAAENRNALGGPLPLSIRRLARTSFFDDQVTISKKRYQHYDLAAKVLYLTRHRGFNSTKKGVLDRFVENYRDGQKEGKEFASWESVEALESESRAILDSIGTLFRTSDPLLGSQGRITLLFHVFRLLGENKKAIPFSRATIEGFKERVDAARRKSHRMSAGSGENLTEVESQLVNFDREKQSINDGGALKRQYGYFKWYFGHELKVQLPDSD